jgi:hypothetical protein
MPPPTSPAIANGNSHCPPVRLAIPAHGPGLFPRLQVAGHVVALASGRFFVDAVQPAPHHVSQGRR